MARAPSPSTLPKTPETIAAVDLGSNSFHMIVARISDGHMQVVDRLREPVRLGEGLTETMDLKPEVVERALACLSRFGQRLREFPLGSVRAVGTNTLRQVRSESGFIEQAEAALGHPIDIIAGREEARLVYLGVSHGLAAGTETRLVVDIGGGSTELIIGEGFTPSLRESVHLGCVSMSLRYFADGRISGKSMERAELAGAVEVRPFRQTFRQVGWRTAVGSSGTIRAIAAVVNAEGWSEDGITAASLKRLRDALISAGKVSALNLKGLADERRPVLAGGVAVLRAVFEALKIEHLQVSDYALREGLIYESIGRIQHQDVRERTVRSLCRQFQVDMAHARRVRGTALGIFRQLVDPWNLDNPRYPRMLAWAARLHEVGLLVAHSQYHKHGAYLLRNADLAGFTRRQQQVLATLVLGHRRRFPLDDFTALPPGARDITRQLCIILRLAVLLHRGRSTDSKPRPIVQAGKDSLCLSFPDDWLASHPLTRLELEEEAVLLKPGGVKLTFE